LFQAEANAQVVINEFSSGTTNDWVELYFNPQETASSSADLSLYSIKDSGTYWKELTGNLNQGEYATFDVSNRLNKDGDTVRLIGPDGEEEVRYGNSGGVCAADSTQSIGRRPDGVGSFVRLSNPTRNEPNDSGQAICPTPSPTPGPTIISTASPTPTPSPSPTAKPTLKPTPVQTKKPTNTPRPTAEKEEDMVLGESDETEEQGDSRTKKAAIALVLLGTALVAIPLAHVIKKEYNLRQIK